jgi:hypothetical protein
LPTNKGREGMTLIPLAPVRSQQKGPESTMQSEKVPAPSDDPG